MLKKTYFTDNLKYRHGPHFGNDWSRPDYCIYVYILRSLQLVQNAAVRVLPGENFCVLLIFSPLYTGS